MLSSGKRADDVYQMMSNEYRMLACDRDTPRRHRWIQLKSKSDPESKGPVADRTTVSCCICLDLLDGDDKDAFVSQLKLRPFCDCVVPCPFQHIRNYVSMIPDPFGDERDREIASMDNTPLQPLHFIRALTGRGGTDRTLTKNNLGIVAIYTSEERT
jgi:hypothetical protein